MKYRLKNGIVRITICGTDMLVPSSTLWDDVNRIQILSMLDVGMINLLLKDDDINRVKKLFSVFFRDKTEEEINSMVNERIDSFIKSGYIEHC